MLERRRHPGVERHCLLERVLPQALRIEDPGTARRRRQCRDAPNGGGSRLEVAQHLQRTSVAARVSERLDEVGRR